MMSQYPYTFHEKGTRFRRISIELDSRVAFDQAVSFRAISKLIYKNKLMGCSSVLSVKLDMEFHNSTNNIYVMYNL